MVRGEASRVSSRMQTCSVIVWVVTSSVSMSSQVFTLYLSSCLSEHGDVTTTAVVVRSGSRRSEGGERMGWRDVGRAKRRTRCRANSFGSRGGSHHALTVHVRREALMNSMLLLLVLGSLVATS